MARRTGRVRDIDMGYKKAVNNIESLHGRNVEVGWFDDDNAAIAFWMEYGFFNVRFQTFVPPRPFIRQAFERFGREWARLNENLYGEILDGAIEIDEALEILGDQMAADIRLSGELLMRPPNAPFTIAKKGFDNPLIETGELLGSVTFEVK